MKAKNVAKTSISVYYVLFILFALLLNQGGYYEGSVILSGLIVSLVLFQYNFIRDKFSIVLFCLSLWYMTCSLIGGFCIEDFSKSTIFITSLIVYSVACEPGFDREKVENITVKFAIILSGISLLLCVYDLFQNGYLSRILFPFNYSNVTGIFFGAMFILSFKFTDKIIYIFRYLLLISLLLTQSVGAVVLTALAYLILNRNLRTYIAYFVIFFLLAVLFKDRVAESAGTFVERLLHINDGISCIIKNSIFGIGAGNWERLKYLYQSGFYATSNIHSSFIQIGVDSGVLGLALYIAASFFAFLKVTKKNIYVKLSFAMIYIHSLIDFTLSFSSVVFILMLLISSDINCKKAKASVRALTSVTMLAFFVGLAFLLSSVSSFTAKAPIDIISSYDSDPIAGISKKCEIAYISSLNLISDYDTLYKELSLIEDPYPQIYDAYLSYKDDLLPVLITTHRYDTYLYDCLSEQYDYSFYEFIRDDAVNTMSYFGELLYKLKGEQ